MRISAVSVANYPKMQVNSQKCFNPLKQEMYQNTNFKGGASAVVKTIAGGFIGGLAFGPLGAFLFGVLANKLDSESKDYKTELGDYDRERMSHYD